MSFVWRRAFVCLTLSLLMISTPVFAQSSRISGFGDAQKTSLIGSTAPSGNPTQPNDGSQGGNGQSGNASNSNSDKSNSGDLSHDPESGLNGNDQERFDRDGASGRSTEHSSLFQSLLNNVSANVVAFMHKWENGPDELVPSFMASDTEINAALTKVLNRPAEHRKPH